jgi:hypothetical protein
MLDCISVENMRRSDVETINQFVPGLALNPVTRKPQNSKAYNRNKSRNWKRDYHEANSGIFIIMVHISSNGCEGAWVMV